VSELIPGACGGDHQFNPAPEALHFQFQALFSVISVCRSSISG